jgi:hypothetical protein
MQSLKDCFPEVSGELAFFAKLDKSCYFVETMERRKLRMDQMTFSHAAGKCDEQLNFSAVYWLPNVLLIKLDSHGN